MLCMHTGMFCLDVVVICPMNVIDMLEMLCTLNLTQIIPPHPPLHSQYTYPPLLICQSSKA